MERVEARSTIQGYARYVKCEQAADPRRTGVAPREPVHGQRSQRDRDDLNRDERNRGREDDPARAQGARGSDRRGSRGARAGRPSDLPSPRGTCPWAGHRNRLHHVAEVVARVAEPACRSYATPSNAAAHTAMAAQDGECPGVRRARTAMREDRNFRAADPLQPVAPLTRFSPRRDCALDGRLDEARARSSAAATPSVHEQSRTASGATRRWTGPSRAERTRRGRASARIRATTTSRSAK